MTTETTQQVDALLEKAKAAYAEDRIQDCCANMDDLLQLLEANGITDIPAEVSALAAACMAADRQTLKEDAATA